MMRKKTQSQISMRVLRRGGDPLCFLITVLAFVIIIIGVRLVRIGSTGFNFALRRRHWRRRGAFLTPPPEERQLPAGAGGNGKASGKADCSGGGG